MLWLISVYKGFISGHVQGVWFRQSTKEQADALGVTGYAKNLPDGRVEVLLCGNQDNIKTLQEWLHHGPPLADVTKVELHPEAATDSFGDFQVL